MIANHSDKTPRSTAPFIMRVSVFFFSGLLTFLWIWLLGFVLADIGQREGPDRQVVVDRHVDEALVIRLEALQSEKKTIDEQVRRQVEIQADLQKSMANAQSAMEQMMSLHRLSLEKGATPSEEERTALTTSQTRFFEAQDRFEQANLEITTFRSRRFEVEQETQSLQQEIREQTEPANLEYQELWRRHQFQTATMKLGVILPLFLLAVFATVKWWGSAYRPLILSVMVAAFWKTGVVMFDHFPREFFKYIAICTVIAMVIGFLVWTLRVMLKPKVGVLIKRYREAYGSHICPVCSFPIKRGAFKDAVWTRKGPRVLGSGLTGTGEPSDESYTCPSCGTGLYQECPDCHSMRHSLLPYCESCGVEKEL